MQEVMSVNQKEYEIVIQSKVTSIIEQEIKYENDYSIPYGEEEVEQQGHNGCTSKTYIIKKLKQKNKAIAK